MTIMLRKASKTSSTNDYHAILYGVISLRKVENEDYMPSLTRLSETNAICEPIPENQDFETYTY